MKTNRADIEKTLNQYRQQHEAAKKALDDFYHEDGSRFISTERIESFRGRILEQQRKNILALISIANSFLQDEVPK
jgi:hypothetical protein